MNLKKLPQEEKPRERLLKYGKNNVSNNELIEIILKSGTKRAGIKEISHNISVSYTHLNKKIGLYQNEEFNITRERMVL